MHLCVFWKYVSYVLSGKNALIALSLLHSLPVSLVSSCQGSDFLNKLKGRKFSLEDGSISTLLSLCLYLQGPLKQCCLFFNVLLSFCLFTSTAGLLAFQVPLHHWTVTCEHWKWTEAQEVNVSDRFCIALNQVSCPSSSINRLRYFRVLVRLELEPALYFYETE